MHPHLMLTDAQKGGDFGFDAAIDWLSARGANEDQVFHDMPLTGRFVPRESCHRRDRGAMPGPQSTLT